MSKAQYEDQYPTQNNDSKPRSPVVALAARVGTLVCLVVAIGVLKTNKLRTVLDGAFTTNFTYKDFHSYKYMFYVMAIGLVYALLQIPFAIYYMRRQKHLINSFALLQFIFYADKVIMFMFATGAGAAFGLTVDLNNYGNIFNISNEDLTNFKNMNYVASSFLVIGCLTSGISSVYSSLALLS